MSSLSGGRLLARALKREGIEQIFTLSGGHIMDIYYGCREAGIRIIDLRSEATGGYAAAAFAGATGMPGVLVTTAGPGVTNATTAMVEARIQGVPLIHVGGAADTSGLDSGDDQDTNTLEIMAAATKWARRVYHTHRIPEYVSMAFRNALAPTPGPVYLEIGRDVLKAEVEEEDVRFPKLYRAEMPAAGDPQLIERAAEMLTTAERPVILVGAGARFCAQNGDAIPDLADYLQAPVAVQTPSRGLFADEDANPLFRLAGAQAAADVVLLLNVDNDVIVNKCRPPAFSVGAKLIQVNTDPTKIGFNAPATVGIVGGAGTVAKQILQVAQGTSAGRQATPWIAEATSLVERLNQPYTEAFASDELPMNPGRCAFEVSRFLAGEGRDWTLVLDGGDAALWMRAAATARRPGQLVMMNSFGPIGVGPGYTVGAWAADGKPVLYYTGDGSFGFHGMDFDTFCRFGIPVVCVISNDSAWGMIKQSQVIYRPAEAAEGVPGVDLEHMRAYEKLALMWDGYGERVTRAEDIIPAIQRGVATHKPAIINVEVDKVTASPLLRGLAGWE